MVTVTGNVYSTIYFHTISTSKLTLCITYTSSMSNHSKFQASDPLLVRVAEGAFHGKKETHTVRK